MMNHTASFFMTPYYFTKQIILQIYFFYLRPYIILPTNVTTENTSDLKKSETWWKYTPHH